VTSASPLLNAASVRVGASMAQVLFQGITAAGLAQFNIVVPSLPGGDYPVTAEIAGVRTAAVSRLRIQG
jgi:uncharacterized protein (TIGR03437 family)